MFISHLCDIYFLPSDIEGVGITLENITTEGIVINADDSSLISLYLGASLNENGGKDRFSVSGAKIQAGGNLGNRILGNLGVYEFDMDLSGLTSEATVELSVYYSKELKLTGSGKFRVSNFDTDNLSLSSSGSGAEINYTCLRSSSSLRGSFSGFSDYSVFENEAQSIPVHDRLFDLSTKEKRKVFSVFIGDSSRYGSINREKINGKEVKYDIKGMGLPRFGRHNFKQQDYFV